MKFKEGLPFLHHPVGKPLEINIASIAPKFPSSSAIHWQLIPWCSVPGSTPPVGTWIWALR